VSSTGDKGQVGTRPSEALLRLMDNYGYNVLGSREWLEGDKLYRLGFQYVAVETLVREYLLAEEDWRGKKVFEVEWKGSKKSIVYGKGDVKSDAVLVKRPEPTERTIPWRGLLDYLPQPPLPLFVVDLSMKFLHTPEELSKLRLQLAVALSVIREYLWDAHLSITGADEETARWLNEIMGVNKVSIVNARPSEILWGYDADKVIILRPDATTPLRPEDVNTADAFLIGGIKTALHSALGWPREGGVGVAGRGRSLAGWEHLAQASPLGGPLGGAGSGARSQRLRRGTCPSLPAR